MKKIGIVLALLLVSFQGWTQQAPYYFNFIADFTGDEFADWGLQVYPFTDSSYLVIGAASDSVTGANLNYVFLGVSATVISEEGTIIDKRYFARPFEQLSAIQARTSVQTLDGGFATTGVWQRFTPGFGGAYYGKYLLKIDANLDSTWMMLDSGSQVLNQSITIMNLLVTSDEGYLIAGWTYTGRIFFSKYDSNGIHLWDKFQNINGGVFSLSNTDDGGFFLTGFRDNSAYICKLDSLCNTEWYQTYNPDGTASNVAKGIPLENGGYFFAYYRIVSQFDADVEFCWMDSNQIIFRKKRLWLEYDQWINDIIELEDHSIVVLGQSGERPGGDNLDRAMMVKFSPDGDFEWVRKYFLWSVGVNSTKGLSLTHDNGFFLTGSQHDSISASPYTDTWFLKVDSIGCPFPNCGPALSSEGLSVISSTRISAYPNPVSSTLTLTSKECPLEEKALIRLYSIEGKQMDEVLLPFGFESIGFDVTSFPAGSYFWEYRNAAEKKETGRFQVVK